MSIGQGKKVDVGKSYEDSYTNAKKDQRSYKEVMRNPGMVNKPFKMSRNKFEIGKSS